MSSDKTELANESRLIESNPLDAVPEEIPFDVPYGPPISLDRGQAVIYAAVTEAKKRNWKMNLAVADSGGNLVAFQRMDGAMLASIQIAKHKARVAATFRRPTKIFEDGIQLMRLNYLLAFDDVIASRGGIPLIEQGKLIGAIGCSGGTDSQDEVVSNAGAAVINQIEQSMEEEQIRKILNSHWRASAVGDANAEHDIYEDDAICEYPQSGERILGRRNLQALRTHHPDKPSGFAVKRILGNENLWITEYIIAYRGRKAFTVSIMEFRDGKVVHETQYFADAFEAPAWRRQWVQQVADSVLRMTKS